MGPFVRCSTHSMNSHKARKRQRVLLFWCSVLVLGAQSLHTVGPVVTGQYVRLRNGKKKLHPNLKYTKDCPVSAISEVGWGATEIRVIALLWSGTSMLVICDVLPILNCPPSILFIYLFFICCFFYILFKLLFTQLVRLWLTAVFRSIAPKLRCLNVCVSTILTNGTRGRPIQFKIKTPH